MSSSAAENLKKLDATFNEPWPRVVWIPAVRDYAREYYVRTTEGRDRLTDQCFHGKAVAIISVGPYVAAGNNYFAYTVTRALMLKIEQSNALASSGVHNFEPNAVVKADRGLNIQGINGARYFANADDIVDKQRQRDQIMTMWNTADPARIRYLDAVTETEYHVDIKCLGVAQFRNHVPAPPPAEDTVPEEPETRSTTTRKRSRRK